MMPSPMTKVEKLDNQMAMINSPDALRKLRGYQSMMQPPIIEREMGGVADVMPEEEAAVMQGAQQGAEQGMQIAQQVPPEMQEEYAGDVAQLKEAARGLAAMGRMGDTELVHMTADELQGLMSLGELTYNPVTGLPEAFKLGKIFKSITRAPRAIVKGVKNVAKSKAFKVLAPIVLGIAAPYALGASGLGLFSTTGALGFGAATALGTGLGSLLAGQKPSDALKSALISGVTAGIGKGISNKMAGQSFFKGVPEAQLSGSPVSYNIKGTPTPMGGAPGGSGSFNNKLLFQGDPNKILAPGVTQGGTTSTGNLFLDKAMQTSNVTMPSTSADIARITGEGAIKPIQSSAAKKGFFDKFSKLGSKDFYKDVGLAMKDDLIVPKDGGGISVLGTAKKVGKALIPTQLGEMAADASAMQREAEPLLTEEEFAALPYNPQFPNYKTYTQKYFQNLNTFQPKTEMAASDRYIASGGGRPMETAAGGEFSGMVPGNGGGMEDNVFMPIKKGREQVGTLAVSPSEYVVDSYTMAALGGGNAEEGAKVMDKTIEQIRKKAYGTTEQPNEIDGIRSLVPLQRSIG